MTTPRRVLLVDSSNPLHRCFHGYPPVERAFEGETVPTNALYGYLEYTLKLYQDFDFDDIVHVLDPEGGSQFRKALYPEYKMHRPPTPPELTAQKKWLSTLLNGFQQPWVCVAGVESDDVLTTLAQRHADRGDLVVVVTSDKDLLANVEDGRILVARYTEVTDDKGYRRKTHDYMDEAAVLTKMGVPPRLIPDFLAIVGDAADNLIGVEKAGPKTAAKWLNEHGDLETLLTHADSIKGVLGENLRQAKPRLPLMKRLTTTLRDVDVPEIDTLRPPFDPDLNARMRALVGAPDYWPDDLVLTETSRASYAQERSAAYRAARAQEASTSTMRPVDSGTAPERAAPATPLPSPLAPPILEVLDAETLWMQAGDASMTTSPPPAAVASSSASPAAPSSPTSVAPAVRRPRFK